MTKPLWKKERGKLGRLAPLMGEWVATAESEAGPVTCRRSFDRVLAGAYVQLRVEWEIGGKVSYEEVALFGAGAGGDIDFWSFTSDGKNSRGTIADVSDIHEEAIGFEAQMPAGLARQAYWPDAEQGFHWAVEAMTKTGWKRFTEHHYREKR